MDNAAATPPPIVIKSIKPQKNAVVEVEAEISAEIFDGHRLQILNSMREEFEIPGFRKGAVPENIFLQHIHESELLERAAASALKETIPDILRRPQWNTLGTPQLIITKLAKGNPLGFTMRIGVIPDIKLPQYQKIARAAVEHHSSADPQEISDKEVDIVIKQIQMLRARQNENNPESHTTPLPDLTDEFVRTLGAFDGVEDFKKKLRENIQKEKTMAGKRTLREKIAQELIKKTDIPLPDFVVDDETRAAYEHLIDTLRAQNITLETYLSRSHMTEAQLHKEQREYVERQLRTRILLEAIAKKENIVVSDQESEPHVAREKIKNPNINSAQLKLYVQRMLTNEKVLEFLEQGSAIRPQPLSQ